MKIVEKATGIAPRSARSGSNDSPTAAADSPVAQLGHLRAYGLAVLSIGIALGLHLLAVSQISNNNLAVPLFLMGIACAVWFAGPGPGALAIVLATVAFVYFVTTPLYTFSISDDDRLYFAVFVVFALLIGGFAARRRRIEADLRVARDELQKEVVVRTEQASLLDLTHDTIFVRNMLDVITYWNRGAQELFGWTAGQAVGKHAHELLGTVFPAPLEQIRAELLRNGRWDGELRKVKADGEQVVVASRWSLRRDELDRPLAILETNNDVTERRRSDERIQQLNSDLARRTIELEATNKELEAFAYSTSHDLRAPLRHLSGYTELLQKHAAAGLDEKGRRYLTMILESAKKMGNLIDDLLRFSRIGRVEAQNTQVSLSQLVQEAVGEVERESEGRRIGWKIAALPAMRGDRSMLKLALVNLLSNAVKFTGTRERAEVEIGVADSRPDEVTVFVRDNGVGFDMKYVHKLFGVFQRLHRSEAFEGTGIGLATVQRIVARHGGRVWAEGVVDKGATFYFSVPRTKGADR